MIAQNIQSYRKETRNTDTSLCSCTHTAATPGPGTKGTAANSVLESASSRPPGHKFIVKIKLLQRRSCVVSTWGAGPTEPPGPSTQVTHFGLSGDMIQSQSPWGHPAASTADQGVSPSTSRAAAPHQKANWRVILLERAKLH